jgi:hypothetical protein
VSSPSTPAQVTPRPTRLTESHRLRQTAQPSALSSNPSAYGEGTRHRTERRVHTVQSPAPLAGATSAPPQAPAAPRVERSSPSPARSIQFESTNRTRAEESGLGLRSSSRLSSPRISAAPAAGHESGASSGLSLTPTRRQSAAQPTQDAPSSAARERSTPRSSMSPRSAPARSSSAAPSDQPATLAEADPTSPRSRR